MVNIVFSKIVHFINAKAGEGSCIGIQMKPFNAQFSLLTFGENEKILFKRCANRTAISVKESTQLLECYIVENINI